MEIIKNNNNIFDYYQVKDGDDLNSIMRKFDLSAHAIIRNNPSIELYTGEVVKILKNAKTTHVVKPMENLAQIANKYNKTTDELIKLNGLKSTRVFVGQILFV